MIKKSYNFVYTKAKEKPMKASILSTITPQYIIDNNGKKTGVLLDLKTFTSMLEEIEDLQDVIEAEKILSTGKDGEGRTIEEIEGSLNKKD